MKKSKIIAGSVSLSLLLIWLLAGSYSVFSQDNFSAQAVVEKQEVYEGESFVFQIQVEGHDAPEKPDVTGIKDFNVESLGGQQNSSSSITIINGKMSKIVRRGYVFSYRLTPKKTGTLIIPAVTVTAGGKTTRTSPVHIRVVKPAETDDFKLKLELSEAQFYVGQPIILTVTWYLAKDVEGFEYNLPLLTDERFATANLKTDINPRNSSAYLRIPLNNSEVIARKGQGVLDGREFMTVSFQKILIAKQAGTLTIPRATVVCNAIIGYRKQRRGRDPFESFFDDDFFFRRRNRAIHQKFVIPSNEPVAEVRELPKAGRPPNFNGLVGQYQITASATPTEVSVGDPITLTIQVSGPDYLENVQFPPLDQLPAINSDFKIPAEVAAGKTEGGVKTFTQTIRAKHAKVTEIPAIELSYFNAERGIYTTARSKPIPLQVKQTRIVTASDAEGIETTKITKNELETRVEGIAHNYEDLAVLQNQPQGLSMWLDSPVWLTMLCFPPLVYLGSFGFIKIMHVRSHDSKSKQARKAYGNLVRRLKALVKNPAADSERIYSEILDSLKLYLGNKLDLPPGARTFNEAKIILQGVGADKELIERLERIFATCETKCFAGERTVEENHGSLISETLAVVKKLERGAFS